MKSQIIWCKQNETIALLTFYHKYQHWIGPAVMLLFTILALVRGEITAFYMLYLFWWQAFIQLLATSYFSYSEAVSKKIWRQNLSGTMFLMGLYFVFLLIVFGLVLNWRNQELIIINLNIFWFKNLFFNLNLVFFILNAFVSKPKIQASNTVIFGGAQIVLHISIIVGAFLHFFVVKRYPEYFSGDTYWASALVIAPFLLLKWIVGGVLKEGKTELLDDNKK